MKLGFNKYWKVTELFLRKILVLLKMEWIAHFKTQNPPFWTFLCIRYISLRFHDIFLKLYLLKKSVKGTVLDF